MIVQEKKTVTVKIKVDPCVECGSENLDVYNCGYSSFNVAGVKCLECGNDIEMGAASWNVSNSALVKNWNKVNNPAKKIKQLEEQIKNLQTKIEKTKKLFNL